MSSLDWIAEDLAELDRRGLRRNRRTTIPLPGGECLIQGRRVVNFASNDYLGLAGDERLRDAARRALADTGVGAGASALISGRSILHEQLEERIAAFEGTEAALLFPTGYAANVGTIAALAGRGDAVFSDELNHASLIDGCRLSRATVCVYPHGDVERLAAELARHTVARRRLIVTDGVFSMDGRIAPLQELSNLAARHGAPLLVDEAHGTGVLGKRGRGACEALAVEAGPVIRVGTLSKSVGVLGGFVAGPQNLVEYLWNRARTQVFSTALPPALCAAACAALEIIDREPERRRHLRTLSDRLRERLFGAGVAVAGAVTTPIIPVIVGDPQAAVEISDELLHRGLFVPAIRPPTVPPGTSRLRISVTAAHSLTAVERLADAVIDICRGRLKQSLCCS